MLTIELGGGYEEISMENAHTLVSSVVPDMRRQGDPPISALRSLGLSETDHRQFRSLDESTIGTRLLALLLDGKSTKYIVTPGEEEVSL